MTFQVQGVCDELVEDRKGPEDHKIEHGEERSGQHVPKALTELEESFHSEQKEGVLR